MWEDQSSSSCLSPWSPSVLIKGRSVSPLTPPHTHTLSSQQAFLHNKSLHTQRKLLTQIECLWLTS